MSNTQRVKAVFKQSDYPYAMSAAEKQLLDELFGYLFPGEKDPEIDQSHIGVAIAAQNPELALQLAKMSRFMALELPWCEREDLREIVIQTVNQFYQCQYAFDVRMPVAEQFGLSAAQQQSLLDWQSCDLFNDEQCLVVQYSLAVLSGEVADTLFSMVSTAFGEKGAIELTSVIGFWAYWAMLLNATYPS